MKQLMIITLFSFVISFGYSQNLSRPKKIREKGTYTHKFTNFEFPIKFDDLRRESIYSFDRIKSNIGVTYRTSTVKLTIFIYPADVATDGRLRNEYRKSLQEIVMVENHPMSFVQEAKILESKGYKLVGLTAFSKNTKTTRLTLYQCGEWFYKIRMSGTIQDSILIDNIEKRAMEFWDPTILVKNSNLNNKADISIAPISFRDSLMLGTILGSAIKKLDWAFKNTDSLERAAGFPDMYLNLHIAAFKELLEFRKRRESWDAAIETYKFLENVERIINNGFIEEFILEEYDYLMLIPNDMELEIDKYKQWALNNFIDFKPDETRYYLIIFNSKYNQSSQQKI